MLYVAQFVRRKNTPASGSCDCSYRNFRTSGSRSFSTRSSIGKLKMVSHSGRRFRAQ